MLHVHTTLSSNNYDMNANHFTVMFSSFLFSSFLSIIGNELIIIITRSQTYNLESVCLLDAQCDADSH